MSRVLILRFLLILACAIISIVFAAAFWPSWSGQLFSGSGSLNLRPALFGLGEVSVPENDWSWSVFTPLPVAAELKIDNMQSITPGSPLPMLLSLLTIPLLMLIPAAIFGLMKKNIRFTVTVFLTSLFLLATGILFSLGSLWIFGPKPQNSESAAILLILDDFYRPVYEEPIFIPGQELVTPTSPYYGGRLVCNKKTCRLEKRDFR